MSILRFLARRSWPLLLLAVATGILSGLSGAWLVKFIGDGMSMAGRGSGMIWMFLALCATTVVSKSVSGISLIRLSQNATLQLRVALSRKLLSTPYKKLQSLGKAELLGILTSDITTFIQAFQSIPQVFSDSVLIVACLGYMAFLAWKLLALFVCALACGVLLYHLAERGPLQKMRELRQKMDRLFKNFRNLVEGSKELQLNARRGKFFVEEVIARDARHFKDLFVETMTGYTWVSNIGAMMFFLVIGAVVFVIPNALPISTEVLTKFTLLLLYLIGPVTTLATGLPQIRQAGISLKKIQQMEGALDGPLLSQSKGDEFASDEGPQLQLHQVCHHYPGLKEDSRFMLGPLSLTVEKGEILFIVGGNGSGKTTLAMLLLGLYEPESGTVMLNGRAVTSENIDQYRTHFSAVFADFHLFEHVLGADQDQVGQRADEYIEKFGMSHKVSVVDGKFSTIDLSTGQRKRLALVSSYLEDKDIYLFDEWAADQDPMFKRIFYTELLPELKASGKTLIVITHDDAYFEYADRVVKLVDGHLESHHGKPFSHTTECSES